MAVTARRRSIAATKVRDQVLLVGVLDGVNRIFTIPGGEKAVHNPSGGIKMRPYHGTRRTLDNEVSIEESGGPGSGYDTVRFLAFAPKPTSRVFADFIAV